MPHPLTSGRKQFLRFLVVGTWNTLFAYGLFALFNYYLHGRIPQPYDYTSANLLSAVVNTNLAFLWQKLLVFRTHAGNLWHEYVRCCCVYGIAALISTAILPAFVCMARGITSDATLAPYLGAACLTVLNTLATYVAHKYYSFGTFSFRNLLPKKHSRPERTPRP
ncbi:TPA: hypothetical protein DDW35_05605 [Candidatus Sumerlaeota bacterium]|jgi:putative flippase GtrA|nr:hypothetical protein [Candidatus Sumerlaeota bacterium]